MIQKAGQGRPSTKTHLHPSSPGSIQSVAGGRLPRSGVFAQVVGHAGQPLALALRPGRLDLDVWDGMPPFESAMPGAPASVRFSDRYPFRR